MKYTENEIEVLCEKNIEMAKKSLRKLDIYCGNEPMIRGLNGWVFEQVIQFCLREELKNKNRSNLILEEQFTFDRRKKADLKISNIIIEIKKEGLFGDDDIDKYKEYNKIAKEKGLIYLYLTGGERVEKYIKGSIQAFGKDNSFFLDEDGQWERFVNRILEVLP